MDYIRVQRPIKYTSESCKMYLRHDFNHRCAYCGISEKMLSPNPAAAEMHFEKDHFLPQSGGYKNVHIYSNLFYACEKCNKIKDNILLPLNPCEDDIYSGKNPVIQGGSEETNYILSSSTPAGEKYIQSLQLNSRYHIYMRKIWQKHIQRIQECSKILAKLKDSQGLSLDEIKFIESSLEPEEDISSIEYLCGHSSYGLNFINAVTLLTSLGYTCKTVFKENLLDMHINISGVEYYAHLKIVNKTQDCRFPIPILRYWQTLNVPCGILQYITPTQKLRFHAIDFKTINWSQKTQIIDSFVDL